jgi:exopolysaccharide biosynthesis polyprenyl glycosylphosphotransferase
MKMLEQPAALAGLTTAPVAPERPWESLLPATPARKTLGLSLARAAVRWPVGIWGTLDACVAVISMLYGHLLSPHFGVAELRYEWTSAAFVFAASLVASNYALGMYDRHNFASRPRIFACSAVAVFLALVVTTVLFGWLGFAHIGRLVLAGTFVFSVASMIFLRVVARRFARSAKIQPMFVGRPAVFDKLERQLADLYAGFYHSPLFVETDGLNTDCREQLLAAFQRHRPDEIVVEDNESLMLQVVAASSSILGSGCTIAAHSAYFERLLGQVPVDVIDSRAMLGEGLDIGPHRLELFKRGLDIALASIGLLLALPVMLVVAALVKLTSPGPIFYAQTRVGRYGRNFNIYKFRSMRTDAERHGAVWATAGDSRVTPVGTLLRKTRLDELPQLWNILNGDMSFVGPRPERPEFVQDLRKQIPYYDLRHLVPPGLTGWAQVRYRYGASVEDARQKLAYDLFYVRRYSVFFDLAICLRTLLAMAKGAR